MFSLLLSIILSPAQAQVPLIIPAEQHPATLLQQLIDSGVNRLGQYDLPEMKSRVMKVQFKMPDSTQLTPDTGPYGAYRKDARFDPLGHIVYLSGTQYSQFRPSPYFPLLLLHEALGAAGYPDSGYSMSSVLFFIHREPAFLKRGIMMNTFLPFFPGSMSHGGTVTGVGNGGDFEGATIKHELVRYVFSLRDAGYGSDYLFVILNTRVELTSRGVPTYWADCRHGTIVVSRMYWRGLDQAAKKQAYKRIFLSCMGNGWEQ